MENAENPDTRINEKKEDKLSKFIDYLFDMKKEKYYVIGIFALAFILRLIAALNFSVFADDMHSVTDAINFYSAGRLVTWGQSSGLWFAFTSILYNIFGETQLASRMAALIFGSSTIIIIYLLSKEFFSEKVSLLSAFLLAIAPFHIKNTMPEMDAMAMFFVLSGFLLFIRATKNKNTFHLFLSGVAIGLAIYTKVYPLLFIPSMILYFIYFKKKEKEKIFTKSNIKKILIFLVAIFIFTIPALTHNYLLYKDKGFLDLQFTRALGLGKDISAQYYSWDAQFERKNSWKGLIVGDAAYGGDGKPLLLVSLDYIRKGDPINFYLGILGIISIFFFRKEHRNYLMLLFFSLLFAWPFLASIILLPKHFMFMELFLIPVAAFALENINSKIFSSLKRNVAHLILLILVISSLILLGTPYLNHPFYAKSAVAQVIEFKEAHIGENDLIVQDSRIYRGRIHWTSYGRPYLEGADFMQLLGQQNNLPGNIVPINVYFIECVSDDCGWGTIQDQPEFNESMESLVSIFKQSGELVKEIKDPSKELGAYYPVIGEKQNAINIYKSTLNMKEYTLAIARSPKNWFIYDIGYPNPEQQFDYYAAEGVNKLLDKFAHLIVLLSLTLAFLSPIYIIYLFIKSS